MTELPWRERVPMLSINPDAATRDDVASLATELMIANHKLALARKAEEWAAKLYDALADAHESIDGEWGCCSDGKPLCDTAKLLDAWKKKDEKEGK